MRDEGDALHFASTSVHFKSHSYLSVIESDSSWGEGMCRMGAAAR